MPAVSGISFIAQVEDTTPGTFITVAGKRGATLKIGRGTADATSGDSAGWEEHVATNGNWSIDEDGVLIEDDAALTKIEDAILNGTSIKVQIQTPSGAKYAGNATPSDLSYEGPHDDVATVSLTLTGNGALTKTAAA